MRTTVRPPLPVPPPRATILVLGATGVGKSSLLSACGGRGFDVGHALKSETEDVNSWTGTIGGNLVTLVDTPGLGDTYTPDSEVIERLCMWLQNEYESQRRISGIILVQRITDNRMTQLSKRSIEMAHQLCGDHAMPNTILCTTFWDKVDLSQGEKREQELREQYWQEMINLGAIVRRHDNSPGSALSIISSLITKPPLTLQLQQELAEGIKLNETSLGIALLGDLGVKEDELVQRIREAQGELATERDRGLRRMLEQEQQKNIAQYRLLEEDRLRMEQNIHDVRKNQKDPENRSKWAQRGRTALRITLMGLGFAGLILALV